MQEFAIEEQLIVAGTHPDFIQGLKDIEKRRNQRQNQAVNRLGSAIKAAESLFSCEIKRASDTFTVRCLNPERTTGPEMGAHLHLKGLTQSARRRSIRSSRSRYTNLTQSPTSPTLCCYTSADAQCSRLQQPELGTWLSLTGHVGSCVRASMPDTLEYMGLI
jgi:hypothetical protein